MEELAREGRARLLGISNVTHAQLEELCSRATILPTFVQNRCFAHDGWDAEVRSFCKSRGIRYQGFSLLTANRHALENPEVLRLAAHYRRTVSQLIFRFALQSGMIPLTGTTDSSHMREDLSVYDSQELTDADVRAIETISG